MAGHGCDHGVVVVEDGPYGPVVDACPRCDGAPEEPAWLTESEGPR